MNFIKNNFLFFTVFLTGACVLVIEITATRILSPFYGNNVFTVSSILTVILSALSIGYYFGGVLADKKSSIFLFFIIILYSGVALLLLHTLGLLFLPFFSMKFSVVYGSLVVSMILFFIPSLLLGILSPFAIKLQSKYTNDKKIGTISGRIFFWSTLGSIVGSLLTGFILIPKFGINLIIIGTSALLIILGIIPTVILSNGNRLKYIFIILFLSVFMFTSKLIDDALATGFVYRASTMYHNIFVVKNKFKDRDIRGLMFNNRGMQSAVYLDEKNPTDLVAEYTKYYKLYRIFNPNIKTALIIGGGGYSIPRAMLYELPEIKIDVSEIDGKLYDIAKKYFNLKDDERLNVNSIGGRRFLMMSNKQYDFIYEDVFGASLTIPAHFATKEFFKLVKGHLNNDGVFIVNTVSDLSRDKQSFIFSEIKTFRKVFPNSYFFAVDSMGKNKVQNIMLVGVNNRHKIDFDSTNKFKYGDLFLDSLSQKIIDIGDIDFGEYKILTDDYAPVDYINKAILFK